MEKIINLLNNTNRDGMPELISEIGEMGFFEAPASRKWHGSHNGGLLEHSLNVYEIFEHINYYYGLNIPKESIAIISLLHDVCKSDLYVMADGEYEHNKNADKRHALKSLETIEKHINLTPLERECIRYHMGTFYCDGGGYRPEYDVKEMTEAINTHKAVQIFAACDMLATIKESEE